MFCERRNGTPESLYTSLPPRGVLPDPVFVQTSPIRLQLHPIGRSNGISVSPSGETTCFTPARAFSFAIRFSNSDAGSSLALQLLFCFEVRALGGGLVSSTPE